MEDYYGILGVAKDATPNEINEAYRKKAMELHPDRNPDGADQFKKVNEAYQTLSDPNKRRMYDLGGTRRFNRDDDIFHFDVGDIFSQVFKNFARRHTSVNPKSRQTIEIDFEESILGCQKTVEISSKKKCDYCEQGFLSWQTCSVCNGTGKRQFSSAPFVIEKPCNLCQGKGDIPKGKCEKCKGSGFSNDKTTEYVDVRIPPCPQGATLRLPEKGEVTHEGDKADLLLKVVVKKHDFYRYEDKIIVNVPVSYTQLVMGDELRVPVIDKNITLKIPPGSQSGSQFALNHRGAVAEVNVEVPKDIDYDSIIKKLAEVERDNLTPKRKKFKEIIK